MRHRFTLSDATLAGLVLLALAGAVLLLGREEVAGAPYVVDGDTISFASRRVRLQGMDAPELAQTCERSGVAYRCGEEARRVLVGLTSGRAVSCRLSGRDRYERALGTCAAGGADLGASLVRRGWAVAYGAYEREEAEARSARAGLWAGPFERPSDWRKRHAPHPLAEIASGGVETTGR